MDGRENDRQTDRQTDNQSEVLLSTTFSYNNALSQRIMAVEVMSSGAESTAPRQDPYLIFLAKTPLVKCGTIIRLLCRSDPFKC